MNRAQSQDAHAAARILVVDDNRDNRELLVRRLTRRGFDAEAASSGAAALHLLSREAFDAVLLDIEMPDMSGLEVLSRVRERYTKTELPVVMATARTESRDMVEAFQVGANDYVTKPLDFPVVVARLEAQLAVRRELKAASTPPLVLAASEDLPAGTVIDGRYRVDEELGLGGFAVVYSGVQLGTGMPVAIKLLRSHRMMYVDAATELARFDLEMRVIAQVVHPAIVRLIDSGTLHARARSLPPTPEDAAAMATTRLSGAPDLGPPTEPDRPPPRSDAPEREHRIPYIVMEKLIGATLADLLASAGPLAVERAIDILLPVLDGMHLVHEEGVIHRDAKPSNIMLCEGPAGQLEPKILDFGIAKLTGDDRPGLTQTASVIGTPTYMSPEQATAGDLDGRSDQYTLAAVLYECLTGEPPTDGTNSVAVLQQIAAGEYIQARLRTSSIDAALAQVLRKALARNPDDRYPDLRAFGEALLPFASLAGVANWQRLRAQPPSGIKPVH